MPANGWVSGIKIRNQYFLAIPKRNMKTKYIATLAIIAFLVHIIWENAQASLYVGYESFSQHFPMCLIGTVGDVAITLLVLAFMRLLKEDVTQATDFLALAMMGFVIAVAIEQHALLTGRWGYAPAMPIIPILEVGLTPIMQMMLLLPLSFYLANLAKSAKSAFT
ncbi:MAG: hypothetical protein HY432_00950 [Candidatus Liptonbacteria bacterium]|nr:hypothetical protein [Candidatus Liptonbacteria bacterium]